MPKVFFRHRETWWGQRVSTRGIKNRPLRFSHRLPTHSFPAFFKAALISLHNLSECCFFPHFSNLNFWKANHNAGTGFAKRSRPDPDLSFFHNRRQASTHSLSPKVLSGLIFQKNTSSEDFVFRGERVFKNEGFGKGMQGLFLVEKSLFPEVLILQ